jgi:hypothetical protein
MPRMQLQPFEHADYTLIRPLFSIFNRRIEIFAPDGRMIALVELPWFTLQTELIVYADTAGLQPMMVIRMRTLANWDREHDLLDPGTGQRIACLLKHRFASLLRDRWDILDQDDRVSGMMIEEGPAIWRRFIRMIPGHHRIELGGRTVAHVRQEFALFRRVFQLQIERIDDPIEPRFAIACALVAMLQDLRRERRG